jgi:AAA domain
MSSQTLLVNSTVEVPHITPKPSTIVLHTPDSQDRLIAAEGKKRWIVDGLISEKSINIAVGDSGLGKSPLLYQLALCVAAGIPWLGQSTTLGRVIYVDLENGERDSQTIRNSLVRYLKPPECPENFITCFDTGRMESIVRDASSPSLVIIDSLRAYQPDAEQENTKAATLIDGLRRIGKKYGTAFLFVHHIKKPDPDGVAYLGDTPTNQWLNQACGARALVNQTDLRIGIDAVRHNNFLNPAGEEAALIVRGNRRVSGEFGPIQLALCFDDDGEPIGYRKMLGVEMLNNDQRIAFEKLSRTFAFKDAMAVYGRKDQATSDFLKKCIHAGLVTKRSRGYEKVAQTPEDLLRTRPASVGPQ